MALIRSTNYPTSSTKSEKTRSSTSSSCIFGSQLSLSDEWKTPLQYFSMFLTDNLTQDKVENTNLYSVQKTCKSVNTNIEEIKKIIGMNTITGVIPLPSVYEQQFHVWFFLYARKTEPSVPDKHNHLQESMQIVAHLCEHLQGNMGHKLFFDNLSKRNWNSKSRDSLVKSLVRLHSCTKQSYWKAKQGSMDCRVDWNTGLFIVWWIDNSTVQLASNFAGIEPMRTLNRWNSHGREKKDIACPKIATIYNKSMGAVDLADMLIVLYRIQCKTTYWYIKAFSYMVDIAKVNAWILYKRKEILCGVSEKSLKCLKMFSLKIPNDW